MSSPRYRPSPNIVGRQLEDEYFLLNLETNRLFELNATGCRIWNLVGQGLSRAEIETALLDEFDVDPAELSSDVGALLAGLVEAGMLQPDIQYGSPTSAPTVEPTTGWLLRWIDGDPEPQLFGAEVHRTPYGFTAFSGYLFDVAPKTDPATHIGELYEQHGDDFADILRGGYVAIVWDRRKDRLTVTRDATGMRTCFYTWDGRNLNVAGFVDTLLALPDTPRDYNRVVIAEYIYGVAPPAQRAQTFYQAINRLPPAHRLTLHRGALCSERYWDPVPPGFDWASTGEADSVIDLLEQSVKRHLSIGADSISLSGGFDSVSLAVLAARHASTPLHALSMRFSGTEGDEGAVQSAVARALGMPMHMIDAGEMIAGADFLGRALADSGQAPGPVMSMWQWIYTEVVAKAKAAGSVNVMLGTGGDDFFNADARYGQDLLRAGELRAFWQLLGAWYRTVDLGPRDFARYFVWRRAISPILRRAVRRAVPDGLRRRIRRSLNRDRWRLGTHPAVIAELEARNRPRPISGGVYRHAMSDMLLNPRLLLELDHASTSDRRGEISRSYPFFERDLVSVVLRIEPPALYRTGRMKAPLRELVRTGLPQVRLPRRKVDVTVTARNLMRGSLQGVWARLSGAKTLADLNIIDPARIEPMISRLICVGDGSLRLVWNILATESWLQARNSR